MGIFSEHSVQGASDQEEIIISMFVYCIPVPVNDISTVLFQKALSAIFTFLQERQKTDYNQLLATLMFDKITKYSAPNCPFTKLSCFFISILKLCLILDNFHFCRLESFTRNSPDINSIS